MENIELMLLRELEELDQMECPIILVRTETGVQGKYETNCPLGDAKCLCKRLTQPIIVKTP
jgi:hypothetical protein